MTDILLRKSECGRKKQEQFQEQWKNYVGKAGTDLEVMKTVDLVLNMLGIFLDDREPRGNV